MEKNLEEIIRGPKFASLNFGIGYQQLLYASLVFLETTCTPLLDYIKRSIVNLLFF